MKPLVSILMPAYNAEKYVADTIRSALEQTWVNKEIIIVDDGSKDATLRILRRFESNGVRVHTQENQGAAATRNRAFELSGGDYIQWLDADDLLAPEKIEAQMDLLARCSKRTLASGPWGQFLHRHERTRFIPNPLWEDLLPAEWLFRKMGQNLHMQTATWLVSRELSKAAGPWNTSLLGDDDGEYFCRVLLASDGVRFVPNAKVYYRATPNSLSYIGNSNPKLDAQWRSMELHINYLCSLENSSRVRAACVNYLQNWLGNFYPERMDIVEQARRRASDFGGELNTSTFSWKYSWIDRLFGPSLAKKAKIFFPRIRWSTARSLDRVLFLLGR